MAAMLRPQSCRTGMELQAKLQSCGGGARGRTITHPDPRLNHCTVGSSLAHSCLRSDAPTERRTAQDLRAVAALELQAPPLSRCRYDASE